MTPRPIERTNEFRAWDNQEKKWITNCSLSQNGQLWGRDYEVIGDPAFKYGDATVVFFTGLLDKNKKKIFESDLVKHMAGDLFEVLYGEGKYYIFPAEDNKSNITSHWNEAHEAWDEGYFEEFEVIGNRFENPDLLSA